MLHSILKNFSVADLNEPEQLDEPVAIPLDDSTDSQRGLCGKCGDTEWWKSFHSVDRHCYRCHPPPAIGVVEVRWFYDGHGCRWTVTIEGDLEVCTKEIR